MVAVPVKDLTKREIIYLHENRCKHGHRYLSHYNCYLEESGLGESLGFLDIECTNLKADFGYVLSYCMSIRHRDGSKEWCEALLSKSDIRKGIYDKRVVANCVRDINKVDRLITYYGCVTPGHKVLTADLRWVLVETLKPGDELVTISETKEDNRTHVYRKGQVVHNIPIKKEVFDIELSNGEVLTATGDHPWMVQRNNLWSWRTTKELMHFNGNNTIPRILPIWEPKTSKECGYIAGFFDGEGGLYQPPRIGRPGQFAFNITASQHSIKNKGVLEHIQTCLQQEEYSFSVRSYDRKHRDQKSIKICGGVSSLLKFLGEIRPQKMKNLDIDKLGSIKSDVGKEVLTVKRIIPRGKKLVCGLETTTGTYFVNGFASHNSKFDIPFLRTRSVYWGLDFPKFKNKIQTDLYPIVKYKFNLHRNRLETACEFFGIESKGHRLKPDIWFQAMSGDKKALDYILEHNREDVRSTEQLYDLIISHSRKGQTSI